MLHLVPRQWTFPVFSCVSLVAGLICVIAVYLMARQVTKSRWAILAPVALSVQPAFTEYMSTPGPDIPAVSIASVGAYLYVCGLGSKRGGGSDRAFRVLIFASGLAFGIAGLVRYHTVFLAIGLLVASLLSSGRIRNLCVALAGVLLGYLPQLGANLAGGFSPFASETAFNIYKNVAPNFSFYRTQELDPAQWSSLVDVVTAYPNEVATKFFVGVDAYVPRIIVLALAALLGLRTGSPETMFAMLAATVVYAIVTVVPGSIRGELPVLPLVAVATGVVVWGSSSLAFRWVEDLSGPTVLNTWVVRTSMAIVAAAVFILPTMSAVAALPADAEKTGANQGFLEDELSHLTHIKFADEMLTNNFSLGFRNIPGNLRKIGGWLPVSSNGRTTIPALGLDDIESFACEAVASGIKYVAWLPGVAPNVAPELDALLSGEVPSRWIDQLGSVGGMSISRLRPLGNCQVVNRQLDS